ncbi:MAG: prephenate dehydrogenase/arogenate dehydrogenase family protein, partial [Patescibacteria group bacterium]
MKYGIIGYGRFGKLWADVLSSYGDVLIYDKNQTEKNTSLAKAIKTDLLFLLVPISEMENCCREIAPLLGPKTIVIDACSVKVHPVKVMRKWLPKNQPIIATHPLFGPDSVARLGLKNQRIVVSPVRAGAAERKKFEKIL